MKNNINMHPQSSAILGLINAIPDYSIKRFLDDMGIVPEKPHKSKKWIKVSKALDLLDISKPKFYKLVRADVIQLRYINSDPYNVRVREADVLGLLKPLKDEKRTRIKVPV